MKKTTVAIMLVWLRASAAAILFLAPIVADAANPDVLKHIVLGACVPTMQATGHPLPCRKVDLDRRFVVLKDILGKTQYLVLPTDPISGIEAPELLKPDAPNYWQFSWEARSFVEEAAGRGIARDSVGLAVNSAKGRSQNLLHIHVDCVRPEVMRALKRVQSAIGPAWKPLPIWLHGHHYLAMRIDGADLGPTDPFKLLAEKLPRARATMDEQTLVVIGATFRSGTPGFYVLNDHAGATPGDQASGEELLDHSCAVLGTAR